MNFLFLKDTNNNITKISTQSKSQSKNQISRNVSIRHSTFGLNGGSTDSQLVVDPLPLLLQVLHQLVEGVAVLQVALSLSSLNT